MGLTEHVTMIQGFSAEVGQQWHGPKVGLLFIDGDHRQDAVRKDFAAWEKHLSEDAVIAFDDHDESHPGVPAAVQGLVNKDVISEPVLFDRLAVCGFIRSEEHTSELQSRPHLVCRLLLEKKK